MKLLPTLILLLSSGIIPQQGQYSEKLIYPINHALISPSDSLIFAIVGDFGDEGTTQANVAKLIKGWNPEFIVTCGDNDYHTDGRKFKGFDKGIGQYFHEYVYNYHGKFGDGSPTWRFFPAIGDHDGNDWRKFSIDNYLDFFSLVNQELPGGYNTGHGRYYQFRWGDVHFFILNTWDWDTAEPDGADKNSLQAKWLQEQAAASDALFKVVISHWPAYGSNWHWQSGAGRHLMDWHWQEMGIDIMFAGNDHGYERVVLPKGFTYNNVNNEGFYCITTAGGGADLYQHTEPYHPGSKIRYSGFGASKITVFGRSFTHQFITPDGEIIDTWTITK